MKYWRVTKKERNTVDVEAEFLKIDSHNNLVFYREGGSPIASFREKQWRAFVQIDALEGTPLWTMEQDAPQIVVYQDSPFPRQRPAPLVDSDL